MSDHYKLIDDRYVLFFENKISPLNENLKEVSLGFIKNGDFYDLARHGGLNLVEAWKERITAELKKYRAGQESFDTLQIVTGKFPIDELNLCLSTEDGLKTLLKRLSANEIQAEEDTEPPAKREHHGA